jgi:primosomal protein N' (replication factor Y)
MPNIIAQIVVGLPVEGPFDYSIPEDWQGRLMAGQRVVVSFAHAKRLGVVVGMTKDSQIKNIKPIQAVLENHSWLDEGLLLLARAISKRYGCSLGEAIELVLPKSLRTLKSVECNPVAKIDISQSTDKIIIRSKSVISHWPQIQKKVAAVLTRGQGIIILVADSAQIPYVFEQLKVVLPPEIVIHDNERTVKQELAGWKALKEGRIKVIIGLRSAVFAPVSSLGLIVMYDEDNAAYKEEQSPFYQTREVVLLRSSIEPCDVLMVAFSPSVEMIYESERSGMTQWVLEDGHQAKRQLIDMTNFASKGPMMISFPLRNSLEKALASSGKVMVVMNRRGHSTFTRCLFCGHIMRCSRCSTNLAYSAIQKKFQCRQCNLIVDIPKACPHCAKDYLKSIGSGVERIALEIKRLFPMNHVERFDREINVFPKRFDVLVTTQAVLRMLGKLQVECIGVLDIDAEFSRADYRSSQKAFSLLTHLSLMAKSSIEVQTVHVDNEVLRHFVANRDEEFYRQELTLRKELKLPPYMHWISIMLRGENEKIVSNQATALYNLFSQGKPDGIDVLNVQPDAIPKLRDQFRFTIFVRGQDSERTLQFVKSIILQSKKKSGVITTVHVDP